MKILMLCFLLFSMTLLASTQGEGDSVRQMQNEVLKSVGGLRINEIVQHSLVVVDTDNDGIPDAWEIQYGLNPNDNHDAYSDVDGDEVINLFEFQLGADPHDVNSPAIITATIGINIGSLINNATVPTVIRMDGGYFNFIYNGYFTKKVMLQGGWDPSFTMRDPYSNPTTFSGQNSSEVFGFRWIADTGVVIMDGIHMENGNGFNGAFKFLMMESAVGTLTLKDCSIRNSASTYEYNGVLNVICWDSSTCYVNMINCLIADGTAMGIHNQTTEKAKSYWRLINNTISNLHNIDVDCFGIDCFTLNMGVIEMKMINQIIYGNQDEDISLSARTGGSILADISYSDYNTTDIQAGVTFTVGPGRLNTNPLFNAPGSNYHLQAASPCIDAGTDYGLPFYGSAPDQGAYEFGINVGLLDLKNKSLVAGPIPADSYLRILNAGTGEFMLTDVHGIIQKNFLLSEQHGSIYTGNLHSGFYILKDRNGNSVPVIIQH